ncbi:MAG: hypothetical protein ABSF32_05790 [Ignavibacteria bacterium]
MVFLAKLIKSDNWKTLSIPKGKSGDFNKSKKDVNDNVRTNWICKE